MNFKHLALAAAVAAASSGAWAENVNVSGIDLSSGSAFFGAQHYESAAFHDSFSFDLGPSLADAVATIITGALGSKDINFTAASLNGLALSLSPNGVFEVGSGSFASIAGPFKLDVWGVAAGVGGGSSITYSGTLTVSPVPEPETYALLLAGLGVVGFIAKRRTVG